MSEPSRCPGCSETLEAALSDGVLHVGGDVTIETTPQGWRLWHVDCIRGRTSSEQLGVAIDDFKAAATKPLDRLLTWLERKLGG